VLYCTTLYCRWKKKKRCIVDGVLLYIMQYSTLLHSTLLHSTPLHSSPLHSTPLHSTLLYSTLLYSTPLHSKTKSTIVLGVLSRIHMCVCVCVFINLRFSHNDAAHLWVARLANILCEHKRGKTDRTISSIPWWCDLC